MVVRRRRGFSLLEAAVVLGLVLTLMVLLTMYFVRGNRYAVETETYATVQRASNQLLRRVTNDLYRATKAYLHVEPDGRALWFLCFEPAQSDQPFLEFQETDGQIVWKKWVCYYRDPDTNVVTRAEQALDPATANLLVEPLPAVDLDHFQSSTAVSRTEVARDVVSFLVSATEGGVLVSLTSRKEAPLTETTDSQRTVEVSASHQVRLMN